MNSLLRIKLALFLNFWLCVSSKGFAEDQLIGDISLEDPDQESKTNLLAQATKAKPVSPPKRSVTKPRIYRAPAKPIREPSFFSWFYDSEVPSPNQTIDRNQLNFNLYLEQIGPGFGLDYVYKSSPDISWIFALSTNTASLKGSSKDSVQETIRASTQSLFAYLDYHRSYWLYPSIGMSLRTSNGTYGWEGSENFGAFSANLMTIEARLTSQWTFWGKAHVGVHWLGSGYPIFGTLTVESSDGLEDLTRFNTSSTPKDRIYQELKSQIAISYFTFYAGYSF